MFPDLDSIPNIERALPQDIDPACNTYYHILQSNRQTRRDQAEKRAEVTEACKPNPRENQNGKRDAYIGRHFAGVITRANILCPAEDNRDNGPPEEHQNGDQNEG